MKILNYKCQAFDPAAFHFSEVSFGKINLLVGDTATGKTRFLNTVFNLGRFAVANEFKLGIWEIVFCHGDKTYKWVLETDKKERTIIRENIWEINDGEEIPLVERNESLFVFNREKMPKLSKSETSIFLLKEEDLIKPIYEGFSNIKRRSFQADALMEASSYQPIFPTVVQKIEKEKNLKTLFSLDLNLNANLFLFSKYFKDIFEKICSTYKAIFPFIREIKLQELSQMAQNISTINLIPVFCVKERAMSDWIQLKDLSSGMQKVLLILTDLLLQPEEGIYIIDEYENSLGINAIDFFPTFITELERDIQVFISSHHPYIINKIPVEDWYIFHRSGLEVSVKHGEELVERFGKSKQKAFIKLINDSFYTEGIE